MHRYAKIIVFLATVLTVLFLASLYTKPHLVLTGGGKTLFIHPVYEGEEFSITYIHSVNQSPVAEIYQIRHGAIVLSALEFEDFGAGMPSGLEEGKTLFFLPCGRMRIEGFDRISSSIRYIAGHAVCLVLNIGYEKIPFTQLAEPGTLIEFRFARLNFWKR